MSKYDVDVGKEFDIDNVDCPSSFEEAKSIISIDDAKTRRILSFVIIGAIVLALLISTIIGLFDNSFDEVNSVWNAASFPLGYILATYFRKSQVDS